MKLKEVAAILRTDEVTLYTKDARFHRFEGVNAAQMAANFYGEYEIIQIVPLDNALEIDLE